MAESESRRKAIESLAECVRIERARRQWSQAEVAQRAGTTPDRIGEIESASVDPRLSTVEKVAEVLDIPVRIGDAA